MLVEGEGQILTSKTSVYSRVFKSSTFASLAAEISSTDLTREFSCNSRSFFRWVKCLRSLAEGYSSFSFVLLLTQINVDSMLLLSYHIVV